MSLWVPKIRPQRLMRGAMSTNLAATNYATVSLYNNSTGAELLAVWAAQLADGGGANYFYFASVQGQVGTTAGAVASVMTGEGVKAGKVFSLDDAAQVTPDFLGQNYPAFSATQMADIPIAILQPNWSLVMQAASTGANMLGAFLWQVIHPQDLDGLPCSACDPHARVVGGHVV